jgi:hypothetical protein
VHALGRRRLEAAQELEVAARARLEAAEPAGNAKILGHLGLPTEPPILLPARPPPLATDLSS